jgi:hypothetical protein
MNLTRRTYATQREDSATEVAAARALDALASGKPSAAAPGAPK